MQPKGVAAGTEHAERASSMSDKETDRFRGESAGAAAHKPYAAANHDHTSSLAGRLSSLRQHYLRQHAFSP